jgi:hypothetical protein
MRTTFTVACLLIIAAGTAWAGPVLVVVTTTSSAIPSSGKVVLDVRCTNKTNHSVRIPSLDEYDVMSWIRSRTGQAGGEATTQGRILDHPLPDRRIEPHQVIRKQISVKLDAKPGDVVEVSCEFPGQKSKLKSNTVVLRRK